MDRTYKRAIDLLNQRIRPQRSSTSTTQPLPGLNLMPSMKGEAQFTGLPSIHGMKEWLQELGHSLEDINSLNIIHISGTKGKGSTCSFTESILRAHSQRTGFPSKTGLYTSPHLIHPEERIRINFTPLPRDLFAKYYFEVEELLSPSPKSSSSETSTPKYPRRPRYLQLWYLLALHTFIRENVTATIIETHHGGEFDSTNFITSPLVTCVTSLGLDHMQQLGSTLESIAWHKSGIFKPGARAVSAPLDDEGGRKMLEDRAREKGVVSLEFAGGEPEIPDEVKGLVRLDVMQINFEVARIAADSFLESMGKERLSKDDIVKGVKQWSWPGRFQREVDEKGNEWFLDGAHNEISVGKAGEWFLGCTDDEELPNNAKPTNILIFAQIGHARDGTSVLSTLARSLGDSVTHVIFTTYQKDGSTVNVLNAKHDIPSLHASYSATYNSLYPGIQIETAETVVEAMSIAMRIGERIGGNNGKVNVLVTGSQHLVGGVLEVLEELKGRGGKGRRGKGLED